MGAAPYDGRSGFYARVGYGEMGTMANCQNPLRSSNIGVRIEPVTEEGLRIGNIPDFSDCRMVRFLCHEH